MVFYTMATVILGLLAAHIEIHPSLIVILAIGAVFRILQFRLYFGIGNGRRLYINI